jgi:peptidoglycan/LPS O-acetylase OafA/YrhL
MRERLSFIDAMRGIAALGVVLYHAKEANHIPALESKLPWLGYFLELGHFGVPIFFVLSGFVIALSLDRKPMRLTTVGRFMMRRSIRIDPPYWVAIIVGIAVVFAKDRTLSSFSLNQIIAHLFYMQELLGYREISNVFWTLCFEFQFYLTYALLMCSPRQNIALAAAIALSLLWPLHLAPVLLPGLFFHLLHGFLLGVCAYWTLNRGFPLSLFFAYAMIVAVFGGSFSIACASTASLIVVVGLRKHLDSLNWRWIQGLGAVSYSLYLIHNPVTGATFKIAGRFGGPSVISDALWWTASLGLCISTAWVMWAAVEKPSTSLARHLPLVPKSTQTELTNAHNIVAND